MKNTQLLLSLLLLLAAAPALPAAVVAYSDRSAWRVAAGGGVGDIVDNLNNGTFDRGSYAISTSWNPSSFPSTNPSTTIDGSGYFFAEVAWGRVATFTFDNAIDAFGFDFKGWLNDRVVRIAFDGSAGTEYILPNPSIPYFRGFVSDTPFTSVTITDAGSNAFHGIDNIEAFSVPEPSRALLLLLGGAALSGRRRRRAAQA